MTVEYVYTYTDGTMTFNFDDSIIETSLSIDTLEIQDLVNGSREAEYSWTGMCFGKICNASGKEYLDTDNGVQVGITCVLLGDWKIHSQKISGVFRVLGGNLVQVSGGDPFLPNNLITYINILSASSTIVQVSTGSGLSTAEHNALMAIANEDRLKELMFERDNTIVNEKITEYVAGGDVEVAVTYDDDGIPEKEEIQ